MSPIEISNVVLFILGVILSLVFTYIQEAKAWLQGLKHGGLVMLGFVVLIAAAYFGLSCTPWAVYLHIAIACSVASAFDVLQALVLIATGNQLAYLLVGSPTTNA